MSNAMFRASMDGITGLVAQADGKKQVGASDELGHLWVRIFGGIPPNDTLLWYDSGSPLRSGDTVSPTTARLVQAFGFHTGVGTLYFQVFNAAAVPANGTVPQISFPHPPAPAIFSLDLNIYSRTFPAGLSYAWSSTPDTLTLAGAVGWTNIGYFAP